MTRLLPKAGSSLRLSSMLSLICIAGIGLALAAGPDAGPGATAAARPTFVFWLPHEAHEGGAQFDARLDKPVSFWRAGLSLKEVFVGVAEQTGVEIGFWPPGDENERVRVNLYLNPERPPSLRDLMAQLAWVTGCTFAYQEGEDSAQPWTYYLLSTSVASGAEERLEEARAEAMAAWRQERDARGPSREAVEQSIAEYERALTLSEGELIARYSGVDDRLLLAMLDPPRRAAAGFVLGLNPAAREYLLDGGQLTLMWDALSPDEQAALESCLGSVRRMGPGGRGRPGREAEDWGGRMPTEIYVGGLNEGMVETIAALEEDVPEAGAPEPGRRRPSHVAAPTLMLTGAEQLVPDEIVALRRALGETISEEEEESLSREWFEARQAEMEEQRRQRTREAAEARLAEQRPLSAEAERTLSSFTLPLDASTPYALWQIQEAVAAVSGMHVVSDCFSQPPRSLGPSLETVYEEEQPKMTGLVALRLSALSVEGFRRVRGGFLLDREAGWEWDDSGQFLRFRSLARDLWRATMLSPDLSGRLDGWVTPQVETATRSETPTAAVDVELDLVSIAKLAAALSDRQIWQAGELVCGDPTDRAASYRQMLRAAVLRAMSWAVDVLRVLATLGDSQWEQLRGSGLRLAYDLTPDQRSLLGVPEAEEEEVAGAVGPLSGRRGRGREPGRGMRGGFGRGGRGFWGGPEMRSSVMRLTAEPPPGGPFGRRGGMRGGGPGGPGWGGGMPMIEVKEEHYLTFWSDDEVRAVRTIPRVITVHLERPERGEEEERGPGG